MSLQLSIVFGIMVFQMTFLLILVLPVPYIIRSKIIELYNIVTNFKNFKVFLIFSISLMSLQLMDCLQRLQKFQKNENSNLSNGFVNYDRLASKFYSQRNLYLSGSILYLTLCIFTVVTIVKKLVLKEKIYREEILKQTSGKSTTTTSDNNDATLAEIEKLKHQIEFKERDIKNLKEQIKNNQAAYDKLNVETIITKDD
ncbi:YET1 [Candida pseudojiufengensis]|uniref:YET1 n=1 Tax=Candida pseudojiufengensis TaxID=497109 RepID=UPI002224A8CF|nr:YET1 [Candida pseudojiufengensis]KAI5959396.1 YET1 [Candida pseudojiufengensis]